MTGPTDIADLAELRNVRKPGKARSRRGGGLVYVGHDGTVVPVRVEERIRSLVIPPAWTDVEIP